MNKVISTENAKHYTWGEVCDGWHLAATKGLSVIQERVPPGAQEVKHFHHVAEQFFYILQGQACLDVDGEILTLHSGQGVHVSANTPHQLKNISSEVLTMLVISTPPSHGDRTLVSE
ncbi:cupin domain-containing protein [Pseudoalteromonas sp. S16_S37]|uniref:cupin domain-containing protein n=1 Tax=Pseudoalteromonas sp. S16_S37 TaxID=2720228 RepID=UPI00168148B5|nr:cupin domain-containing protein [Pseudoalteromonas sp. S16_S37]MBD1581957.1 cupin domain-containing protein [Pseudoalteromonas sp. S16_S37]